MYHFNCKISESSDESDSSKSDDYQFEKEGTFTSTVSSMYFIHTSMYTFYCVYTT